MKMLTLLLVLVVDEMLWILLTVWLRAGAGISTAAVTIYSYLLLYVKIMLLLRMLTGITLLHVNAVDGFGCC